MFFCTFRKLNPWLPRIHRVNTRRQIITSRRRSPSSGNRRAAHPLLQRRRRASCTASDERTPCWDESTVTSWRPPSPALTWCSSGRTSNATTSCFALPRRVRPVYSIRVSLEVQTVHGGIFCGWFVTQSSLENMVELHKNRHRTSPAAYFLRRLCRLTQSYYGPHPYFHPPLIPLDSVGMEKRYKPTNPAGFRIFMHYELEDGIWWWRFFS